MASHRKANPAGYLGPKILIVSSLLETPEAIADHVLALYSAKLLAYTKHDPEKLVIDLEKINLGGEGKEKNKEGAVFIHTSQAGVTVTQGPGATVEKR